MTAAHAIPLPYPHRTAPGTQAGAAQAGGGGQVAAGAFASAATAGLRTFADVATRPAAAVEVGRQELVGGWTGGIVVGK